jgi:hypothetical protein
VRENRGILYDSEEGIRGLRKEQSLFQREGDPRLKYGRTEDL